MQRLRGYLCTTLVGRYQDNKTVGYVSVECGDSESIQQ